MIVLVSNAKTLETWQGKFDVCPRCNFSFCNIQMSKEDVTVKCFGCGLEFYSQLKQCLIH